MSKDGRPALLVLALVAFAASVVSLYVHYQLIADPQMRFLRRQREGELRGRLQKAVRHRGRRAGSRWRRRVVGAGAAAGRLRHAEIRAARRRPARPVCLPLSVVGLASVFYFAYASFFVLQKACPLCMAVYVAVIGIFLIPARWPRRSARWFLVSAATSAVSSAARTRWGSVPCGCLAPSRSSRSSHASPFARPGPPGPGAGDPGGNARRGADRGMAQVDRCPAAGARAGPRKSRPGSRCTWSSSTITSARPAA